MKFGHWAALASVTLLLAGCDHAKTAQHAKPVPRGDSEYTGLPPEPVDSVVKYPRVTLVSYPPGYVPPPSPTNLTLNVTPPPAATTNLTSDVTPPPGAEVPTLTSTNSAPSQVPPVEPMATPPDLSENAPSPAPSTPAPTTPAPPNPTAAPAISSAVDSNQVVALNTSYGKIVIELDDFAAPRTCKNFRQLVQDGFYNNTVFHRIIPNFIIQGGDPKSKSSATNRDTYGLGGPGYTLPPEIELKHDRGAVAMARLPDFLNPKKESNGSQFYICLAACPTLDDQYTVFGHVIQGLDIADKIAEAPRDKRDNPLTRIEMTMSLENREPGAAAGGAAAGAGP